MIGESEVDQAHFALGCAHHVREFEIEVHDPAPVQLGHGTHDFHSQGDGFCFRQRPVFLQVRPQVHALDVVHDQVLVAGLAADPRHVGIGEVLKMRCEPHFVFECHQADRVHLERLARYLDDPLSAIGIAHQVQVGHGAFTDLPFDDKAIHRGIRCDVAEESFQ